MWSIDKVKIFPGALFGKRFGKFNLRASLNSFNWVLCFSKWLFCLSVCLSLPQTCYEADALTEKGESKETRVDESQDIWLTFIEDQV